jgi:hypothetical protein
MQMLAAASQADYNTAMADQLSSYRALAAQNLGTQGLAQAGVLSGLNNYYGNLENSALAAMLRPDTYIPGQLIATPSASSPSDPSNPVGYHYPTGNTSSGGGSGSSGGGGVSSGYSAFDPNMKQPPDPSNPIINQGTSIGNLSGAGLAATDPYTYEAVNNLLSGSFTPSWWNMPETPTATTPYAPLNDILSGSYTSPYSSWDVSTSPQSNVPTGGYYDY